MFVLFALFAWNRLYCLFSCLLLLAAFLALCWAGCLGIDDLCFANDWLCMF